MTTTIEPVTISTVAERKRARRDSYAEMGAQLAHDAETDADAALQLLRLSAMNLGVGGRNIATLSAAGCPPLPARYFGAWRNLGYSIRKGCHGYPSFVRSAGRGYRLAWRFAACDVQLVKGDRPIMSVVNRPVSRETLSEARAATTTELAAMLLALVPGGILDAAPFTLADLDAARFEVVALGESRCLACGWDGTGDDGGCVRCR